MKENKKGRIKYIKKAIIYIKDSKKRNERKKDGKKDGKKEI